MAGEITRAVLTERCRSRRFRAYTTDIASGIIGTSNSAQFQILDGTYFLWTDTAIYQPLNIITPPARCNIVQIERGVAHRRIASIPFAARSMAGLSLALPADNSSQEYSIFEPNEVIRITVDVRYTDAANTTVSVILGGIEFQE